MTDLLAVDMADWAEPVLSPRTYKSLRGGRGSGKSHALAQVAILRMAGMLTDFGYSPEPVLIASARAQQVQIKQSVKRVVENYIRKWEMTDEFEIRGLYIAHKNGSMMTFPGIEHQEHSFMSMEGIDILWIEQAEFLTGDMMSIILPSIRKATAEHWFSWNPFERSDWCWERFVSNPRPADLSLWINWRDNPWWDETGLEGKRLDTLEYEPHLYAWEWEGYPNDTGAGDTILPYATLKKCVRAHREGLAPEGGDTYGGLDLAWGGADRCALAIRTGPTLHFMETWPGVSGDLSHAAVKAWDLADGTDMLRLYYDSSAQAHTDLVRAGFRAVRPVNFGGEVGGKEMFYERRKRNKDMFARRNIQMADAIRLRANRTLKLLDGKDVDPRDCLFIDHRLPQMEALLSDLSQPKRKWNTTRGLWEIEKAAVDERSPDRFDALCLAYARETDGRGLRGR